MVPLELVNAYYPLTSLTFQVSFRSMVARSVLVVKLVGSPSSRMSNLNLQVSVGNAIMELSQPAYSC